MTVAAWTPKFEGSSFAQLPLPGGKLFTYAGGTNTPLASYTDQTGSVANTNPVILDAAGRANVWLTTGVFYKLVLQDRFGNTIWTQDNFSVSDPSLGPSLAANLYGNNGGASIKFVHTDISAAVRTITDALSDSIDIRALGAKGDYNGNTGTDDTAALQAVFDRAILLGKTVVDNKGGSFLTGPLDWNGTGHAEPANSQWQALKGFRGAGRMSTVFVAKSGGYGASDWIIKARNASGVTYQDFGFNGLSNAQQGADFSWYGGQGGDGSTAPSTLSIFRGIYGEGVTGWGFNFDQVHDSVIDGIWSRGVSGGNTAFTFRGPGGQMNASRIYASTGRVVMSCQNGGLSDCGFFGGYEISGSGFNAIVHNNVHFYPDPTTSMLIRSSSTGNAPAGCIFNSCFFNPSPGWVIGGNWWQGAEFNGCLFNNAAMGFYATITPLAGTGDLPMFTFGHCTFFGGPQGFPGDVAGQAMSSHLKSRTNSGASYTSVRIPGPLSASKLLVGTGTPFSVEQATFFSPGPDTATAAFGSTAGVSTIIYAQSGAASNAASATIRANASGATGRSASFGGTVNVGGADYAEYHTVVDRIAGTVQPGQIIGFDGADHVTDKWSESVGGFGIKSSDPSFVGGDRWAVGLDSEKDSVAYEEARRHVDRIAYSGRVPVNVQNANPGDYIVAAEGPNDSIIGQVVSAESMRADMSKYLHAVGRVRSVLDDGRVTCAVLVH